MIQENSTSQTLINNNSQVNPDNYLQASSQHFHITGRGNKTALDLLAEQTPLSKQLLKKYAQKGSVWIQRNAADNQSSKPERLRRLKKVVAEQDTLDFYYNPQLLNQEPAPPTLVADFIDYSVWIKPRGMLSQGSKWADHTALYRWIEMNYQPNGKIRQAWIVHRLDRATHGLMLIAHSKKIAASLSRAFEENQVHKTYQALVWGKYPDETQTIQIPIDKKQAISHVRLLNYDAEQNRSLVEVDIETGRKHQIRRHLSETGYPIIGDRMYGVSKLDEQLDPMPDLQLTAYKLCLPCPITQTEKCFTLKTEQLDLLYRE
ncbi:RluA family pseudouridine synthase [Thiomicrorhabdus lithotrophica]|uniref:RluA family pseudouridine synthase n=1 Tax=Thiomicrorhabdus lithotrophica TaxID=2949997 RepID=A0ABY8CA16_9GAMM|nr:RluA family pseudouridine synthase [Thiomicrorhabdus lithotrophica]WEJ62072.1 RluA family pseudouridine synthase [Thiomicrorhabdus lithotrophica]